MLSGVVLGHCARDGLPGLQSDQTDPPGRLTLENVISYLLSTAEARPR